MIVLHDVVKKYGNLTVLDHVSLEIHPGEFTCIIGPSGAGKSTLLSLLLGATDATEGSVSVDRVDLRAVPAGALQIFRRRVGIVFQDYKLLQQRTVAENIAFPLEVCGMGESQIQKRVLELLQRMDLTDRAGALPRELSGGEKARVAIARAIAHTPLILLADEPTGNLNDAQGKIVLDLLREINKDGATVVVATHDQSIVRQGTRVIALEHGRVVSDSSSSHSAHKTNVKEKPETQSSETHKNIEKSDDNDPENRQAHTSKKRKNVAHTKKKIKITSIHSE